MGKKGMNALETIFMLFILIIVVVVVVQMFTKFTSAGQAKLGASLKEVEKVSGYKTAIQTCENACSDYRATGSEIDLINFCTRSVEMDIDFSGKADEGEPTVEDLNSGKPVMLAPIGYVVCEKNIYCPQLTNCNNRYNLDECLTKLCRYYYNKYRKMFGDDNAIAQAEKIIQGLYSKGECDIDGIISEGESVGIPSVNWYKEYIKDESGVKGLNCAERLGKVSSSRTRNSGDNGDKIDLNLPTDACIYNNFDKPCFGQGTDTLNNGDDCTVTDGEGNTCNGKYYKPSTQALDEEYVTINGKQYRIISNIGDQTEAEGCICAE